MTNIKSRLVAMLAAFALVVGCGLAFALPQQAQADPVTAGTTAGSSMTTAKTVILAGKSLKAIDDGSFSSTQINKWYKFTTSNRNSQYKVTLKSEDGDDIKVRFYDSTSGALDDFNFTTSTKKSRTLWDLDRNATYYIQLSRSTDGTMRADYSLAVKEIVTPPNAPSKFYAWSKAKNTIRVNYKWPKNTTGFQIAYRKGSSGSWTYKTTKHGTYVIKKLRKNKKYSVKVRAYRTINKKKHYGPWTATVKLKANGKKVKYYA